MSFNIQKTIVMLRTLQLTAHNAHHITKGPHGLQDHELLGEIYPSADTYYDSLVELAISNNDEPLQEVLSGQRSATLVPKLYKAENNNLDEVLKRIDIVVEFATLARKEKDVPGKIDTLLGDMQRDFGTFQYKLKFLLAE